MFLDTTGSYLDTDTKPGPSLHETSSARPYAERFVRSIKEECLNRMVLLGRNTLERALREYRLHYLRERNHQGLGNRLLEDFPQGRGWAQRRVPRATRRPTSLLLSWGCLSRYVRVPSEPPGGFRIVVALTSAGGLSNPRFAQIRSSTLHRPTSSSTYYLHHTVRRHKPVSLAGASPA